MHYSLRQENKLFWDANNGRLCQRILLITPPSAQAHELLLLLLLNAHSYAKFMPFLIFQCEIKSRYYEAY